MKKLFTEYWQEFDVQYIKKMYGAELPLFYFVIYWSWSLVFGHDICHGKNNTGGGSDFSDGFQHHFLCTASDSTVKADVSVSAGQSGAAKAGYGQISFPGGASYDGLHSRHGSGSIYGAGRTVLVSAYFME